MPARRTLLVLAALTVTTSTATAAPARPYGDSRVVAQLPATPGYPEGIAVQDGVIYVATAARFGTSVVPPLDPPEVQAFDAKTGALVGRWVVQDRDESQDHGLSGLAFDGAGRLYALDTQWGVIRFDPATTASPIDLNDPAKRAKHLYASAFPDLPACAGCPVGGPPSLPNDLAFASDGTLFVSDSLQGAVWRVAPPAPGTVATPEVWSQDSLIAGAFGPNGIRFDKHGVLHLVVSADSAGRGQIYRLRPDGTVDPAAVHTYLLGEVPDNVAFGKSGRLYVALAGSNQIQVLAPDGSEITRFSGPARRDGGLPVPYDMPSGVAIDSAGGRVLANNHSEVLGIPDRFVVFDVYVDDRGEPLVRPAVP